MKKIGSSKNIQLGMPPTPIRYGK